MSGLTQVIRLIMFKDLDGHVGRSASALTKYPIEDSSDLVSQHMEIGHKEQ